jgi:MFS family permease
MRNDPESSSTATPAAALLPLYLGEFFILAANGIAFTAVAARAVAAGLDSTSVGAAGSAYYAGLFLVFIAGPALVSRMGLRALALGSAPVTLAGLAVLTLATPPAWFAGRFTMGVGVALLYVVLENWINLAVGHATRGRALAVYMAVYFGSYAASQAVLLLVSSTADVALGIAAGGLVLGLVCFAVAVPPTGRSALPRGRGRTGRILRYALLSVGAAFASGMAAGAFYALGPVYAIRIGLDPDRIGTLMIAVIAGASVAQFALGVASDRFERRHILVLLCVVAASSSLALCLAERPSAVVFLLAMAWGSSALTGYAVAAAIAYDAPHGRPPAEVAQAVLLANGIGGIVGPAVAAQLDALAPAKGLFVFPVALFAVLGLLLARRR